MEPLEVVDNPWIVGRNRRVACAVRAAGVDLDIQAIIGYATGKSMKLFVIPIHNGTNVPGDNDRVVQHDDALPRNYCPMCLIGTFTIATNPGNWYGVFGPRRSGHSHVSYCEL